MDVHFVDAEDGKTIGVQIEFGEPEAIGTILAFSQFLARSDNPKLASLATTVTVVATIMAQDASAGMLALEAWRGEGQEGPKAEPVLRRGDRRAEVHLPGRAWQVIERYSAPGALDSFRPETVISTGGSRARFGLLDEGEMHRLIAAIHAASQAPGPDRSERGSMYQARRQLEQLAAETFGD